MTTITEKVGAIVQGIMTLLSEVRLSSHLYYSPGSIAGLLCGLHLNLILFCLERFRISGEGFRLEG